jgi:hypothetical protein
MHSNNEKYFFKAIISLYILSGMLISVKTLFNDFKIPGRCFTIGHMAETREFHRVSD